jgi:hypothetical protein
MNNPSEQLENITEMITKARDAVYAGTIIDMTKIQGLVQEVCIVIQQNPPADGWEGHDKIISIITNLNLLAEELKNQQKQVEEEAIKKGSPKNQAKT